MVAVAMAEEDRLGVRVDEVPGQDLRPADVDRRARQLGAVDVAVEQDNASEERCDVGGVGRPGKNDLVVRNPALLVHVLDAEELLPRLDERWIRVGGGGERGQNAQDTGEGRAYQQ